MSFETLLDAETIERFTGQGFWLGKTITDFLDEAAAAAPDQLAFVDSRRSITYAALKAEVDRCAWGMLAMGIRPGDVVSFQLPNWIEFIVVNYAATRIGAISNPLIPIYREREVGFMVGLAESRLIVVPSTFRSFDHAAMVESLRKDWPALQRVLVVDAREGEDSFEAFMATPWEQGHDPAELAAYRPDANEVSTIIFTSGTTGEPKGVMHTHNTLVAANVPIPARMGLTADSVIHMASTLAHLTGFLYGARLPVQNGLTCILQDIWNADEFLELVRRHRISYTSGATPFLLDLLGHLPADPAGLESLTRFCCMGAPIPRVIVREAMDKLPHMAVLGGWGQTENGLVTIGIPGDPIDKIASTDGYPWPGMQIRTVDALDAPVEPGSQGRLQVRGPFLFVGYARRLELTRTLFTADGWFDTGDLAEIDADGYVKISGRTKDIIIRGGENIPVAYVENVLYEHPEYRLVAVVAVPDPRLQERAAACIVPEPGAERPTLDSVKAFLQAKGVAKQYWPEHVVVLDEFPQTASGKIQKYHLREIATAATQSAGS